MRAKEFYRDTSGQDLVEYALLMAMLVLLSAAFYIDMSDNIAALWNGISSRLADPG